MAFSSYSLILLICLITYVNAQNGGLLGSILGNIGNGQWGNLGGQRDMGPQQGGPHQGPWGHGRQHWHPNGRDQGDIPPPRGPPNMGGHGLVGDIVQSIRGMTNGGRNEDVLEEFEQFSHGGKRPRNWRRRARKFCRRFPGHPKCRNGGQPQFGDIQNILQTIFREGGKYLPRIPKIFIRDPLAGINQELAKVAKNFNIDFGSIDLQSNRKIKNVCRSFKCKERNQKSELMKKTVVTKVLDFEKTVTGKDHTDDVNLRMDRTLQIKQALLEKANLTDEVLAADDGVFDQDVLLSEKQQTFLLNELGKGGVGTDALPPVASDDQKRARRAAIFFEEHVIQKWDIRTPIPYTFSEYLEEYDKNDVRGALREIEQKTCLRFQYNAKPTGYHISYQKVDSPTFCGLSYIGRVEPANPVYLSFQCGNARGVALHETMHALGVNHQHLRMDRDQHITVDWSNINPQHYDYFVVADSKLYTTYGVKYDYGSIMHYNAYSGSVNVAKPTMIPKVNEAVNMGKMGQRTVMSAADVEILTKMYCQPGCDDKNVYCGAWALKELCNHPNHKGWMVNNCRRSCNFCSNSG